MVLFGKFKVPYVFEGSMSFCVFWLCRFQIYVFSCFRGLLVACGKIGVCERSNFVKVCGKSAWISNFYNNFLLASGWTGWVRRSANENALPLHVNAVASGSVDAIRLLLLINEPLHAIQDTQFFHAKRCCKNEVFAGGEFAEKLSFTKHWNKAPLGKDLYKNPTFWCNAEKKVAVTHGNVPAAQRPMNCGACVKHCTNKGLFSREKLS